MAKQYWLKRISNYPAEGPYTAQQLRALAQQGQITQAALISPDQQRWYSVANVKGLFPPKPGSEASHEADSGSAAPGEAPAAGDEYGYRVEEEPQASRAPSRFVAQGAAAATGSSFGGDRMTAGSSHGPPGQQRNLTWYIVLGVVIVVYSVIATVVKVVQELQHAADYPGAEPFVDSPLMLGDCLSCFVYPMLLGMWIYFLVWIYTVHQEMAEFTQGAHCISPSMALGLCFVPLFNLGWQAYALYRLSETVADRLGPGQRAISPPAVLTLAILAAVPGCCLLWPMPLLMGVAMHLTQKGLNALWSRSAPPLPGGWGPQPY